jgi:hypothetical protein
MSYLVSIEGHSSLKKDIVNGGVVNVDKNAYKKYLQSKELAKKAQEEKLQSQQTIVRMEHEINSMKQDMNDIKKMLESLVNKDK